MVSLQDFKASLKLLRGSKKVILSLTDQAKCLGAYAQDVVDAIVETIDSQTQSDDKMPCLYLLDSIVKSVGQPFTEIIQSRVSDVFCRIFMQAKKDVRVLLHMTRLSWSQHFPSEVLIPLDMRVRAMDPAWPDFKVTKVAGQVMSVPAPRISASSSRDNTVSPAVTSIHEEHSTNHLQSKLKYGRDKLQEPSELSPSSSSSNRNSTSSSSGNLVSPAMTGSHQEHSTNQLQFKVVYRGDKQRKEPWPQFTNVGCLLQRMASPTECTIYTPSVFLTPSASPSDVGFNPGFFEVTDGPGHPIWDEPSSSSATHQNPVISEPAEVTASSPRHTLRKESSSSRDRHCRHSSSVSKRHREESPASISKRRHREMASLQDFKASLKLLEGSKKVIFSLTDQAKCLGACAQGVVNAIIEYIDSQTQSDDKVLGLFLLDSIFKNVGSPFADIIQSRVSDIFCRIFIEAKEDVRVLLQTTRLSWNWHFPSEVLIPLDKRVRAMDPAWPDFQVTKVAGQGMSLPTPSSTSSSSSHWHNSFVSKRQREESPAPPSKRCRREH